MIYTETIEIKGRKFIRTYSDTYMIERDGELYGDAVDPVDSGRTYTESAEQLETIDAAAEDYQAALEEMGVSFDDEG